MEDYLHVYVPLHDVVTFPSIGHELRLQTLGDRSLPQGSLMFFAFSE